MTVVLDSPAAGRARHAAPSVHPGPMPVLAVIGAGVLVVVGLWWQGTPAVHGLGAWLTGAGRITGLLAGYAVVVLLALMARVPALERGVGADRLARWHAQGGRYAVGLVVAHALLITWGYAVIAHTSVVNQTRTLLDSYPDMLSATAGGLGLVGIGVVSARAARARLRYETWYYLHLATYLAVFLAFGHQLSAGAQFVGDLPARLLWYTLYGGVAALLLWYRFLTPLRAAFRHRLHVAAVRPEAPGVVSIYLTGQHLDQLRAQPGQFFRWRFLTPGLWWTTSPYSLSAPAQPHLVRITVKAAGGHSRALARLRPGVRVLAEGPYGALTAARRRERKVLLLAGGIGITPLRALFETLPAAPGELSLVYRASHPDHVVFRAELDAIAAARGARVHYLIGPRTGQADPLSVERLAALVPDLRGHDVYLCGPAGMTEAAVAALRGAGVRRRRIHHESFAF